MNEPFIIGNWKSNKTVEETREWIRGLAKHKDTLQSASSACTIVVCTPYTSLYVVREEIHEQQLPIAVGAQDISPFGDGAYTGAVSARMIKELAEYVIIGHSERRKYFQETDEMLQQKTDKAKEIGLRVIYCIPDEHATVAKGADIIGYEPVWAIGTGKTDTPENAGSVIASVKERAETPHAVYGGSVKADNVQSFLHESAIGGVLLGGASLDPDEFVALIKNAISS